MASHPTTVEAEADTRPRPFHDGAVGAANGAGGLHPEPAEFDGRPVAEVAAEVEEMSAAQAIAWGLEQFGQDLLFATSFQKTSSVVVDIASKADREARFFYLDTDLLFKETYATRDALASHYGVSFERYAGISLTEQETQHGSNLWRREPDACCGIRKVEPMKEALSGARCWVAGLRRKDSQARAKTPKFAWDKRFGLWKLNPLADWSDVQVWNHIRENEVPYNELHDRGYPSIGCTHCTSRPGAGENARAGRWANLDKTECGINE
ncbi:phosphoadenylyl-sulfate reductase [soil metagenome]